MIKSVLIVYNQALTEKIEYVLDILNIRGYTKWENVQGRGSVNGDPRLGTHTWPEMNSATLAIVEHTVVEGLLEKIQHLNAINEEVGVRAFIWSIEKSI